MNGEMDGERERGKRKREGMCENNVRIIDKA